MINRLFAILTLGPLALWIFSLLALLGLNHGLGCGFDAAYSTPCSLAGIDLAGTNYGTGVFVVWAPFLLGPIVLVAGVLWGLVALIRKLRKRKS
ncbi:hypothetical protein [Pseudophaeobacter sp.]|uniref:hypothetical protein n=1 Tax=Pseudophaeobacter sp. TaxID=1971739 RepID=UPI003298C842